MSKLRKRNPVSIVSTTESRRAARKRFRAAADRVAGYVYECKFLRGDQSADHQITWASEHFRDVFGCSVEDYNRGKFWMGRYHPDDLPAAAERAASLRRGEMVEAEVRLLRPHGKIAWLHVLNQPVFDPSTRVVTGVLGFGHDITDRKLAEQALRKSESLLRSVTSSDSDCLLLLNLDLKVQFLNRPLAGTASEIQIGHSLFGVLHHQDRVKVETALRSAILCSAQMVLEARIAGARADAGHLEIRAVPVREQMRVTGLAVRITDISERRRTEEKLQTHATILETMHEGVIMFDAQGRTRFSNSAAQRMFEMDAEQLSATHVSKLGMTTEIDKGRTRRAATRNPANHQELVFTRIDGSQLLAELAYSRIDVRDQPMFIAVVQDATEQKKLERELVEIAVRDQQRIAIDLHDGLGQELTGAALLLRSLADKISVEFPDGKSSVEEVIGLLNHAINDARTLAHGLSPVDLQRGGLSVALDALASRNRETYGVDVRFQTGMFKIPEIAAPVANHLYRIAQEAVANGLRHSGAKTVSISLSCADRELELCVTDDGCGIGKRHTPEGSMGLRIMDYRARMIGAELTVDTRAQGGTAVRCLYSPLC